MIPTTASPLLEGLNPVQIEAVTHGEGPLLIVAGFTTSMNYDPFNDRMMTLPVFV